jgi:hypothetical protein
MRCILPILFLISLNITLFGQESFKVILENTNDEYPRSPVQLTDGSFILPLISRATYFDFFNQQILHISAQGNILNQILITNPDGDCHIHNMVYANDSTIIGIGEWKINGQNSKLWYVCIDANLQIRWEKKYETNNDWFELLRSFIDSENNVVSCVTIAPYAIPGQAEIYFMKANLNGDSITSRYELSGTGPKLRDIFEKDSSYLAFGQGFMPNKPGNVISFDKSFNLLSIDSIPYDIHNTITAKYNNDSSYYLAGDTYFGYTSQDIMITILDKNNDCQVYYRIGRTADTIDMGGADISMDYFTKTNILVGGTSHVDLGNPYYSSSISWYSLTSFDSLLNIRWTKYYGGDSYYLLRSIVATNDGGALLSGTRYNYLTPDNKLDVYVLKVDSAGIYTGTEESHGKQAHDAIIYPNPGSDLLNIQSGPQISGAQFTLYDMKGNSALEEKINTTEIRLNTRHLRPGIYPWQIVYKNKVIESGKWVKE